MFLLLGSITAVAQPADERDVLRLFYKKFEWMRSHRLDSLQMMLDERLMYIHSNGWVEAKSDVISNLKTGKLIYRNVVINDASVRIYSNTAIITGKGVFEGVMNGTEFSLSLLFTEIYIRKEGTWLLASRHANRLP